MPVQFPVNCHSSQFFAPPCLDLYALRSRVLPIIQAVDYISNLRFRLDVDQHADTLGAATARDLSGSCLLVLAFAGLE